MAKVPAFQKILAGASGAPRIKIPSARTRVPMGSVPDQAPRLDKAGALLAGVPMSVRGRKPRLGSL